MAIQSSSNSGLIVEVPGYDPSSWPCKGRVLPIELYPPMEHRVGVEPTM